MACVDPGWKGLFLLCAAAVIVGCAAPSSALPTCEGSLCVGQCGKIQCTSPAQAVPTEINCGPCECVPIGCNGRCDFVDDGCGSQIFCGTCGATPTPPPSDGLPMCGV